MELQDDKNQGTTLISSGNIEDNNFENSIIKRALFNDLVLDVIIKFLSYASFLNFRLVCNKWYSCSERAFWKRSRINYQVLTYLDPSTWNDSTWTAVNFKNEEEIYKFGEAFPLAELPTNSIKFQGYVNGFSLDYIFLHKGSSIKELFFQSMYHRLSKIIVIGVDPYIGPNITKLNISDSISTMFFIPLNKLVNVKYLYLDSHCSVILNGKIKPKELSIVCNSTNQALIYNGERIREWAKRENWGRVLINEFVDFSEIQKLNLTGRVFKLNVAEFSPKLQSLELIDRVVVVGWVNSKWQTNRFKNDVLDVSAISKIILRSVSKTPNSRNFSYNDIDFTSLPDSIERLSFTKYWHANNWKCVYPNLKYLNITTPNFSHRQNITAGSEDFTLCANLKDFELNCGAQTKGIQNLKLIKLPISVKRMKLHGVDIEPGYIYQLDVLVLMGYPPKLAECVISHFETNQLVLEYNEELLFDEEKIEAINFWKGRGIPDFIIKGFKWTEITTFVGSEFSKYVDAEGTCYRFYPGEPGKAINPKTFDELSALS